MYMVNKLYNEFKRVEGIIKGKPLKDNYPIGRLSKDSISILQILEARFNTIWQNINPYIYFKCGFELWKTFSLKKALNEKIINLYIRKDKRYKRIEGFLEKNILDSLDFIKKTSNGIVSYAGQKEGFLSKAIIDYNKNKIDKYLLAYLIYKGFLKPTTEEEELCSYVICQYSDLVKDMDKVEFVIKEYYDEPKI